VNLEPLKLVIQEDPSGCVVATAAMCLGLTYQEARAMVHPWFDLVSEGIDQHRLAELFSELGYAMTPRYNHIHLLCTKRDTWPPTKPWAERHVANVITRVNTPHAVVLDQELKIYDPCGSIGGTLADFKTTYWVAGVHRVGPPPMDAMTSPTDPRRRRHGFCTCDEAWEQGTQPVNESVQTQAA
jgi:hypothetical protein